MKIKPYLHKVQYYETDQMGVVHHSNYIRWLEEARTDMMDQMGCCYAHMEELGIMIPVLEVNGKYRKSAKYNDTVVIHSKMEEYTGAKVVISYVVTDESGENVLFTGSSKHCFLSKEGKLVYLKRENPDIHQVFLDTLEAEIL